MKVNLAIFILLFSIQFSSAQTALNDTLVKQLDTIYENDQLYRGQLESVQKRYGWESNEMKALQKNMRENDSINQIKVTVLLDKYGWLGTDVIGTDGNTALFMVVQHAALPLQEKYLPMMRTAVKDGKAKAGSLALLEDRVALKQGKKQIYDSQLSWNMKTNEYYVMPLLDPDNVDKRRAEVGLPPIADYLEAWQLKWNAEQYKKDLPAIEARQHTKIK